MHSGKILKISISQKETQSLSQIYSINAFAKYKIWVLWRVGREGTETEVTVSLGWCYLKFYSRVIPKIRSSFGH